jgi:hypothetical protein
MSDSIEQSIDKIEVWLSKRSFALFKSKLKTIEDEVDFDRKIVFLSLRSKPINQLYSLLHECGHVVVRTKKDYKSRFRATNAREAGTLLRETNRSIVEQIEEEILAWREGYALAQKLNIDLIEKDFYQYGFRWVMSYITLGAIGKEHYLPIAFQQEETNTKKQITKEELTRLLDNAHETCYNQVIANPLDKDQ